MADKKNVGEYERWLIRQADKKEKEYIRRSFDSLKSKMFHLFVLIMMLIALVSVFLHVEGSI